MYIPMPWATASASGRQREASGQRLLNFFPAGVIVPQAARVPVLLHGVPGTRKWLDMPAAQTFQRSGQAITGAPGIHGLVTIDSPLYGQWVAGVYDEYWFFVARLDSATFPNSYDPTFTAQPPVAVPIGNTQTFTREADERATGPVRIVTDNRYIMLITSNTIKAYDLGKQDDAGNVVGGFLTNVAPPLPDDASPLDDQAFVDAAWVDSFFFIAVKNGRIYHSLAESLEFDQAEFAHAESEPDEIVGLASWNRRLYVFGSRTVEQWYNAGQTTFSFRPDRSWTSQFGCGARDTIAVNEHGMFFLAHTGSVYYLAGPSFAKISTDPVDQDIGRSDWSKARGYTYTEEGHWFYSITLTFADNTQKTWVFDFMTKHWHERSDHDILCVARLGPRILTGRAGQRFVSQSTMRLGGHETSAGVQPVEYEAVGPPLFQNAQSAVINSFQLDIPHRAGGEQTDAVKLDWSDDAGETWRPDPARERPLTARRRYKFNRLGSSRARNIRARFRATRRVDVLGAYIEAEVNPD